ncbi:aldehyde dehydrogenase (NAD+) [Lutimaribacter pacificus]|uniref:aldehyde dehydrogenase (NAD(+)) n=1 Tax=Lutimaribacter pacificus TaxID=391948 RepID=A0A1H0L9T2_9RHOB|nr:aldehyde dehydrogenase family protein [Lutimaribacter pacificus]SDO64763.1 aldehyde dehydrogenase (NAD+) [Lutimaribacter pacificus]SHK69796.1 aldehyde dehydrogenase (NAD+) [Lutimaribacter pacificus]
MHSRQIYIDGEWRNSQGTGVIDVFNPATERKIGEVSEATAADVDSAVEAAQRAFATFSRSSVDDRIALLEALLVSFEKRKGDIARVLSDEMGCPITAATNIQAASGPNHLREMIRVLRDYDFDEMSGTTLLTREPIGVCGLITPWNFPVNQIICKVAPAIAAGCTMVLKPSEEAPLSGIVFAEIADEADLPKGVFNLVNGYGATVGAAISGHPGIDMVSFTGSTRAGIEVARAAANNVKRVAQELGGKAPNILLDDVDLEKAVAPGVARCFGNAGQSCSAATRMLVPRAMQDRVAELAREAAATYVVGDPSREDVNMGPMVNAAQYDKVQELIQSGIDEGATLICGGTGKPDGLNAGHFVKPTIFTDVTNDMRIAREEIFGPVLSILPYDSEEEAIGIANDTPYGLAAYVQSASLERARAVGRALRAGGVHLNYPAVDRGAPFGGYKQSGNGREWGRFGLEEFLEIKAIVGYGTD